MISHYAVCCKCFLQKNRIFFAVSFSLQFGSPDIENLGKFSCFYTLRGGFSTFFVEKLPRSVHPRLNGVYFFFSASFSGSAGSGVM